MALYLSVRYHLLHPGYLRGRMRALVGKYKRRVLLCHVDVSDSASQEGLLEVTKLAFLEDWTLICAWSAPEVRPCTGNKRRARTEPDATSHGHRHRRHTYVCTPRMCEGGETAAHGQHG